MPGQELTVRHELIASSAGEAAIDQKVEYLVEPISYAPAVEGVLVRGTSYVMGLSGRRPGLQAQEAGPLSLSRLLDAARREAACRAELRLNRRLAPDVYLGVVPLIATRAGLSIGGGEHDRGLARGHAPARRKPDARTRHSG